ncbi:MAG TPA: c-type cytochrome [Gammaproteobacteria bacterium]
MKHDRLACLAAILAALAAAPTAAQERAPAPSGASLYASYCSACHGATGEGDGPVAAVMTVTVPNLRTLAMRSGGTFPTESVTEYVDGTRFPAAHGSRQMPIWGEVFEWDADGLARERARERIDAIVAYLAEIQY